MEVPKYYVKPALARVLVPQTILLFCLGGIFYALLTTDLLLFFKQVSSEIRYLIIAGLLVLLIAETAMNYVKTSNMQYNFLKDKVVIKTYSKEKSLLYNEIHKITFQRNLLDRLFNTVTIVFTPKFKIKFIKDENKISFNIQKLVQRSRKPGAIHGA